MKKLTIVCAAFVALLSSCHFTTGSGNIVNEKKQVGNFTGINVSNGFEVEVKIGTTSEVRIEADDNIMQHIKTEVSGNILAIKIEGMHSINNAHLKAYVIMTDLNSIVAGGGSNVKVLDVIKSNGKINFDASGGADIEAEVEAPGVEAEASGGAGIKLTGKTKSYTANASGGGRVRSANLLSESTDVHASGGGHAEVYGSVSINAKATGGGSIKYSGEGALRKEEDSGGSVNKD